MGLEERRAIKTFQESVFPGFVKEIRVFASCPVEVDWDSLAKNDEGVGVELWSEYFEKVYFRPLITALKDLARDNLGKEALSAGLKKIEICNKSDNCGSSAISFENGVLKIDHKSFTNVDDVSERSEIIVSCLSRGL
jgi:hypothetical protein